MTSRMITAATVAVFGLAAPAFADAPGMGGNADLPTIRDIASQTMVDNRGYIYTLSIAPTGGRPQSGTIAGFAGSCFANHGWEVAGTFLGVTVHLNVLTADGACMGFVADCTVNLPTKTCTGTYTDQHGGSGPYVLTKSN